MGKIFIVKADGHKEPFEDRKLLGSLLKSRLGIKDASSILSRIKRNVRSGISTEDIRERTFTILCKRHLPQAQLYNLRVALSELPPRSFEQYIMRLFEKEGYKCEWERIIRGEGTSHEVDVIAKKDPDWFLVECKHRGNYRKISGLDKVLQVRARFEDIADGYKKGRSKYNFTSAWVVNNAKFSNHAIEYAKTKGIILTGWGYPKGKNLAEWIQGLEAYPITIIHGKDNAVRTLISKSILTSFELEDKKSVVERLIGSATLASILSQISAVKQC